MPLNTTVGGAGSAASPVAMRSKVSADMKPVSTCQLLRMQVRQSMLHQLVGSM